MYTTTVFSVRVGRRFVVWIALTILVSSFIPAISMVQQSPAAQPGQNLTITVLYDNNPYKEGLETAWGFSCLIEGLEKTILFDTGGGTILLANLTKLGIHPEEIDLVVLSHIHSDHVGGLPGFLEKYHDVTVYLPNSFPAGFKNMVTEYGAGVVEIQDPLKICDHVYSSGELGEEWLKEQALILHTDHGVIVITGCAHPGIVKIIQKAKDVLKDEVLLVMGGFHLSDESKSRIENIVSDFRKLGVQYVGPCHCSGDSARNAFQKEYQNNFIPVGVGTVINLEELP